MIGGKSREKYAWADAVSKLILAIKLSFFDDALPVMGEVADSHPRHPYEKNIPCLPASLASGPAAAAPGESRYSRFLSWQNPMFGLKGADDGQRGHRLAYFRLGWGRRLFFM